MKCFTVFELEIHDRIAVVENGIGINGKVAVIADGVTFPKPDMAVLPDTGIIHPFAPARPQIFMRADFNQYRDPQTGINRTPIIIKETSNDNGWALVLWIIKKDGPYYFQEPGSTRDALSIVGPVECQGYVQYLIVMANAGSDVWVKPKRKTLNLHYSHGSLKFDLVKNR